MKYVSLLSVTIPILIEFSTMSYGKVNPRLTPYMEKSEPKVNAIYGKVNPRSTSYMEKSEPKINAIYEKVNPRSTPYMEN